MRERQPRPLKYREIVGRHDLSSTIPRTRVRSAFRRLLTGTETPSDRARIERAEEYAKWDIDMEDDIPEPQQIKTLEELMAAPTDASMYRRYAMRYRGLLKRAINLQARVSASESGFVDLHWTDKESNHHVTQVNQGFVDWLFKTTDGIREELYDGGYQSVVNKIHTDLGFKPIENTNMEMVQAELTKGEYPDQEEI